MKKISAPIINIQEDEDGYRAVTIITSINIPGEKQTKKQPVIACRQFVSDVQSEQHPVLLQQLH